MSNRNHDPNLDQRLADAYNDPKLGLRSAKLLWEKVREKRPVTVGRRTQQQWEPSYQYVKNFIANQASHSTHTSQKVRHYLPIRGNRYAPFERMQMDIMFPGQEGDKGVVGTDDEKNQSCILVLVDTVTRYLFAYPMTQKNGAEAESAFKKFLSDLRRLGQFPPVEMDMDSDSTFEPLKDWCEQTNEEIEFKTSSLGRNNGKDELFLAFIDRAIRTLRTLMSKYQVQYDTTDWAHILPQIVEGYNNTAHSVTEVSPLKMVQGSSDDSEDYQKGKFNDDNHMENAEDKAKEEPWYKKDLQVGDLVRVPVSKENPFYKQSKQKFRTLPYPVKSIDHGIYYNVDTYGATGIRTKYKKYQLLSVRNSLHSHKDMNSLYNSHTSQNQGGLRRAGEQDQITEQRRKRRAASQLESVSASSSS